MSFVPNEAWNEQTSLYDSYSVLTERSKKFLNRSWAKYFGLNHKICGMGYS